MKTIFNKAKRRLRYPHYAVVFDSGGIPDYRVVSGHPSDARQWQQKHLQGKETGPRGERPIYLINIYGKGKGWL